MAYVRMAYQSSLNFSPPYDDDQDPDYVYYNASIINDNAGVPGVTYDPTVRFNETRGQPLIKDASQYNFSIVRFTMNGPNKDLPLFIPRIVEDQPVGTGDVNKTVYQFSIVMTKGGVTKTVTRNVIYSPETQISALAPVPLQASVEVGGSGQQVGTRYYWVYSYNRWLTLCNQTLANLFADLATEFAAPIITEPPFLVYDPTTNLFTIYADNYGFGGADRNSAGLGGASDEEAYLWFNANTTGLFDNFENEYYGGVSLTNKITIKNKNGLNINTTATPASTAVPGKTAGYYTIVQDYESTSTLWSPVASVVFTSSLLPLVNEETGDPVRYGNSTIQPTATTQYGFQPIITDVQLVNESAADYRKFIQYAPTAEYRLASFQRSKQPINQVDIQVFWKNRLDGQIYPLQMFNLSSVEIKIMFRRRGVSDYPHPKKLMGYNV